MLCTTLRERRLHDDFGCLDFLVLKVCEFMALGKTSFTEEFAFEVLLDADVPVEFDDLLFDDCCCLLSGWRVSDWFGCSSHSEIVVLVICSETYL